MAHSISADMLYNINHHFKKYFYCLFQGVTSEVVNQVYNEYIGNAENRAQVRDGLLNAIGDPLFVLSAIEVARYHRGKSLIQHLLEEM